MAFTYRKKSAEEGDIDVTSFMSLMVVLIPVLLLSMSFTQISVLELQLPELTGGASIAVDPQAKLEIEIDESGYKVFFPDDVLVQQIPRAVMAGGVTESVTEAAYDLNQLSLVLQAIKQQNPDKKDVLVRSGSEIRYQYIVDVIDTVKSYKTVVAASVVEIELFPEVSLDEARAQKG